MAKSTLHLAIDGGPKKGETLVRRPGAAIRIGRVVRGNTIAIRDPSISYNHLSIQFDHQISRWALADLDTSNGTEVNGVRVAPAASFPLSDGDAVKIGENTLIFVKIVVDEEDALLGSKRVGRRGGSVRVLKKDEIFDSVQVEDAPRKSRRGRRGNRSGDSESDMVMEEQDKLGRALNATRVLEEDDKLDSVLVMPKNLPRGRRGNCFTDSKEGEVLENLKRKRGKRGNSDMVIENETKADDRLGKELHSARSMELDLVEDGAKVPKNLPRGKRGKSLRVSKTNESLESVVNCLSNSKSDKTLNATLVHSSEMPANLERRRGKRGKSDRVSKSNQVSNTVVEDDIKALDSLGRGLTNGVLKDDEQEGPKNLPKGRRGNSSRISKTSEVLHTDMADSNVVQERALSNVSQKGEALVPVVEGSFNAPKDLGGGRRSTRTQVIKKDEVSDLITENNMEGQKGLGRGRSCSNRVSKSNQISSTVVEDDIEALDNLGRGLNNRVLKEDEKEAPKNLRKGRRGNSLRGSKTSEVLDTTMADSSAVQERTLSNVLQKGEALVPVVEGSFNAPKELGRGRRSTRTQVVKEGEVLNSISGENIEGPKCLRRGRSHSNRVSKSDQILNMVVEDDIEASDNRGRELTNRVLKEDELEVPKNLPKGRRGTSSKASKTGEVLETAMADSSAGKERSLSNVSQKGEALVTVAEGSFNAPKDLERGRRSTRTQVAKKDEVLNSVSEENIEVPKGLRRGRSHPNAGLKEGGMVLDGSIQVPENVDRKRSTRSSRVLKDNGVLKSIVEDKINVPKDLKMDPLVEDTIEEAVNLGRGKRRATSTRTSKKDDMVSLLEESLRVPEAAKERPRKAPARRTRAASPSARLSTKEQHLESALPKGPVLIPVENAYYHKDLRENSNQLGQNMKESDKENCSGSRNSFSKQIPDAKVPVFGSVGANFAEPSRVFPKVWNGNGIPNSTSKYKEDSKVSWHATPFEERLERVLSGDNLCP